MKMTLEKLKNLRNQLKEIKENLNETLEAQRRAAEAGDLSENEEYSTARALAERLLYEKSNLETIIGEAEIVQQDSTACIMIGSTIEFCQVDKDGNEITPMRTLRVEEEGDTIIQKILGTGSSLGKAILNGTNGIYTVPENGGIMYKVRKIIDE